MSIKSLPYVGVVLLFLQTCWTFFDWRVPGPNDIRFGKQVKSPLETSSTGTPKNTCRSSIINNFNKVCSNQIPNLDVSPSLMSSVSVSQLPASFCPFLVTLASKSSKRARENGSVSN